MNVQRLFSLEGRVVLVTGASSGIGRHFAGTLAAAGGRVAACARRRPRIDALAAEIGDSGGEALAVPMDVTDPASVEGAVERVERDLGPVDVLVNNAGVATSRRALEFDDAEWERVMATNLSAAWRVARTVCRRMVDTGRGGVVVNTASILGLRVGTGLLPYAVSKAGLIQMTRGLALEVARHGIRVNALAPGYIRTDMNRDYLETPHGLAAVARIPQRRAGEPADLDGALLLLASDASSYMTGEVVTVDGGHLHSTL